MRNAILLHGWNTKDEFFDPLKPTASNDHWFPWLSKQLMVRGWKVDVPEMTQYDMTTYSSWKAEFERFEVTPETILVGHSCGGGFLIRYLSENSLSVGKVFLVAPWLGVDAGHEFDKEFFNFEIDSNLALKSDGLTVISSDDDFEAIQKSVDMIRAKFDNVKFIELHNKGHFTKTSLGGDAFPELLEEITR